MTIINELDKNREIYLLEKLNKRLNILNKSNFYKPNFEGLNTSSIKLESDKSNNTTENIISLVNELEETINILNTKYKNNLSCIDQIQKKYNQLNTNLQRIVYIIINHGKIIKDLEETIDNFNNNIKNIENDYIRIKKETLFKSKSDKNLDNPTFIVLKNKIDRIDKIISTNLFENIKKQVNNISNDTISFKKKFELIEDEISQLQKSNSEESYNDDEILSIVTRYHDYVKNNVIKINDDIRKLYKKYERLNKSERVSIEIPNLLNNIFDANIIYNNNFVEVCGESEITIQIKNNFGIIQINKVNRSNKVDVIGNIKFYDNKTHKFYKGMVTNKNFFNKNPNNDIIYYIDDKNIPSETIIDGFINIKIRLFEN